MWPDVVNGAFEMCGALFIILNIRCVFIDKQVRGISWLYVVFISLWGFWNLFYYPHLGQWWSFAGGIAIVTTNTLWFTLLLYYKFVKPWPGIRHVKQNSWKKKLMAEILDQYRKKCVRLEDARDKAQAQADRYLKRVNKLVYREQENRRRILHLTRSLIDSVVKRRAQARTLREKDLKAISRNEEIRILTKFKETMVTAFPDIEENITKLRRNVSTVECPAGAMCSDSHCVGKCEPPIDHNDGRNNNDTPNMATGDGLE